MNIKEIEKLADLMTGKNLSSLEYTEGDRTIKLSRNLNGPGTGTAGNPHAPDTPAYAALRENAGLSEGQSPPRQAELADASLHTVVSPIVGVFYAAPSPESKPFVSLGDKVKEGDVLCVVETMKMMNEITSDVSGEIAELCASNKQIVEFGQPLFKVRTI